MCQDCRREGRGPARTPARLTCQNPACGKVFETMRDKRRRFCSRRCAATRGLSPGESRARRKADVRARRAVVASTWDGVTDKQICERDGWECQIFGCDLGPLRRDLLWPDALSPSIDHIVPLSRGGTDIAPNKRAAHLFCNVRRHNRMTPDEEKLVMPELAPLGLLPLARKPAKPKAPKSLRGPVPCALEGCEGTVVKENRRYCSSWCSVEANRRRARERYIPKYGRVQSRTAPRRPALTEPYQERQQRGRVRLVNGELKLRSGSGLTS